jgi:hypothetical protein
MIKLTTLPRVYNSSNLNPDDDECVCGTLRNDDCFLISMTTTTTDDDDDDDTRMDGAGGGGSMDGMVWTMMKEYRSSVCFMMILSLT